MNINARLKDLQQILDSSDPFLLEALQEKSVEVLLEMKKTETQYRKIYIDRGKPLTEIDSRIAAIDALVEMKLINDLLLAEKDLNTPVGGISLA